MPTRDAKACTSLSKSSLFDLSALVTFGIGTPATRPKSMALWVNVIAGRLIVFTYLLVSATRSCLVYKQGRATFFRCMFLAFGFFAVARAGTHFNEAIKVWIPASVLFFIMKIFPATTPVALAALFPPRLSKMISLIQKRKAAQQNERGILAALEERDLAREELSRVNTELEGRVRDRTIELELANLALQAEVDDRIRIEKQLVRVASVVEYSNDAILTETLDGIVATWNKAAERIYGYKAEEIIGKSISILAPQDRPDEICDLLSRVARGEIVENHETTRVPKDGRVLNVSLTVSPIRNLMGEITGASVIARDITQQKLAEAALRQNHQRLRNILDNIFTFVGLLSTNGTLMEVNRAPLEASGLRREDVIGQYVPDTYWFSHSPQARERVKEALQRAAQGYTVRFDEVIRATGDQLITIDLTYSPLKNEAGEVVQIVGSAVDITDRKRTELALLESEQQYRLLFDSSPQPMWVYDHATLAFLAVNKAAIQHYGYSQEEFLGMTILDIRSESEVSALLNHIYGRNPGLQPPELWRHRKKDGTIIDVEVTSHELAFRGRNAQLVLANDISERLRAETDLRHSEERFSKTFRSSPLPITISVAADGRYIDVNDAFLNIMEYQRDEVIGRRTLDLNIWADPNDRKRMMEGLATAGRIRSFETQFVTRSGGKRSVIISAEIIQLDGIACVLAITNDVTETRRLEDQFRQAQKMEAVGRLAGGVAHDFNNMLGVILGYSDLSRERLQENSAAWKHNEQIRKAALRASGLTRQLLAFSRQQVLQPSVLNLNAVVNNTSKMLLRIIGEDITLHFVPGEKLGNVQLDLGQIEQVLMNLVVNARDAMPRGGKIVIETANAELDETYAQSHMPVTPGAYVMLAVADTGTGVEKDILSRIFEPFFTTKPVGVGTGLGLSMVYGVVQQSGGNIWVYSEVGKGTAFKMYFPRVEEAAESLLESTSDIVFATGNETILLVEDEEALRELTAELLDSSGYKVLEAASGESAMAISKRYEDTIHLLLTDVIMSGMSGSELAVRLKESRPAVKVLYMSGYTGNLIANYGVQDSKSPLIQKPFTKQVLLNQVRSVLDTHA